MRRNIVFVVIALLLIGASLVSVRMLVHADANQRLTLSSDIVPLVQRAHLLQAADPQQQLHLSIALGRGQSMQLDIHSLRHAADIDDRKSRHDDHSNAGPMRIVLRNNDNRRPHDDYDGDMFDELYPSLGWCCLER